MTFDDGTADFVDVALPIIERHRVPVTLYAATKFIDEQVPFPNDGKPVSSSGLADACATGLVKVGSHTHHHHLLDRLPLPDVIDELDRSIDLIGDHLGRRPADFAYPKALLGSPAAELAVRERFRSAALAGTTPNAFRAHRSPPSRSIAHPDERRHDLVPPEGRGRDGSGGPTPRGPQPTPYADATAVT